MATLLLLHKMFLPFSLSKFFLFVYSWHTVVCRKCDPLFANVTQSKEKRVIKTTSRYSNKFVKSQETRKTNDLVFSQAYTKSTTEQGKIKQRLHCLRLGPKNIPMASFTLWFKGFQIIS